MTMIFNFYCKFEKVYCKFTMSPVKKKSVNLSCFYYGSSELFNYYNKNGDFI